MAYKINFGQYSETKNLYIVLNGVTNVSTWNPTEVTGAVKVTDLILDAKDEEIFTPWIKQSLQVSLIRENDTDFQDIIDGTDNTTYAIVVSNGTLELAEGGYLALSEGAKLDFIGTLTMETYGEQYTILPEVNLTFHDRIGFLDDEDFEPKKNRLSIVEFLAEILPSIIVSKYVLLEWPYSDATYSKPDEFFYDFAPWFGMKKSEVFEQFLKDHGLQMVCDFRTIFSAASTPYANVCGCVLIRVVNQFAQIQNEYYLLERTDTVVGSDTTYSYAIQTTTSVVSDGIESEGAILVYPYSGGVYTRLISINIRSEVVVFEFTTGTVTPGAIKIDTGVYTDHLQYSTFMKAYFTDFATYYDDLSTTSIVRWRAKTSDTQYNIALVTLSTDIITSVINAGSGSTVTDVVTIDSNRTSLNTSLVPLIENAAQWELFRKAKNIIAVHTLEHEENLIFKGTISEDDFYPSTDYSFLLGYFGTTRHKYITQLITGLSTISEAIHSYIEGTLVDSAITKAYAGFYLNDAVIKEPGEFGVIRPFVFYPISLYNTTTDILLTLNLSKQATAADIAVYYLLLIKDQDGNFRYWDGNSWEGFLTSLDYLDIPSKVFTSSDYEKTETITLTNETGQLYLAVFCVGGLVPVYVNNVSIESDSDELYLTSIKLETTLYSNNRKNIDIETKFGNVPDIDGAEMYYRNCISNENLEMPLTLNYKTLAQTLLAHLSDMYGANYQVDRWYLSAKPKANDLKLYNPFEMENKVFMLIDGSYNLKTGALDGKFAEVVYTGYADTWQWDDGDVLEWDDGDDILIG